MKKVLYNVKYDLKLSFFTKSFFMLLIFMFSIFVITQYNQINKYNALTKQYIISYNELKDNGENPDELLKQDFNIIEKVDEYGGVSQFVDNHLRYDFENMKESRTDIEGTNIIVMLLKNSILVFLSICVAIYMIYFTCFEFSEKTLKTRLLMGNFISIFSSKLVSGIILITSAFIISLFSSTVISYIWSVFETQNHSFFNSIDIINISKVVYSVIMSYIILLIYMIAGFGLGILIRKTSVAIVFFLLLHLIVPSFGKYDYKNLILTIYDDIFGITMSNNINFIKGINVSSAILILLGYILVILLFGYFKYRIDKRKGVLF